MRDDTFKVVKIIDDKQIVVNVGSENNIKRGDEFEIYQMGVEVFDNETNESLGTLDYIKGYVEATTVYPLMSLCKRIVLEKRNRLLELTANPFEYTTEVSKSLNIKAEDISGGFENIDRKIKVGDLVRTPCDN